MPTYEMFWDCPACGTTKLLGKSHRHCPACGRVQDPERRYFPAEHEKIAVEDHAFHGVDQVCERCDTPNSAAASHCVNCGDAMDGSETAAARRASVVAGTQSGVLEPDEPPVAAPPAPWWIPGPLVALGLSVPAAAAVLLALAGIGAVLVLVLVTVLWTSPTTAEVVGHSWQRDIAIERYEAVRRGGWCDGMPSDAYRVSRSTKQRSTKKIPDGETCSTRNVDNGDGTFSTKRSCRTTYRSEPVYDDHCDYTIDRWTHAGTETARGTDLSPRWPRVGVKGCARLGCTREGRRRQTYTVHLVDADGADQPCTYDQDTWTGMAVGSRWRGPKQVVLDNLLCGRLEPEEAP